MSVEDVLLECDLMLMDVGHQLAHWAEELEQARFAARLDGAIEVQMNCFPKVLLGRSWAPEFIDAYEKEIQRADEIDSQLRSSAEFPLAWYEDGTRFEIGTASVDPVTGIVTARVEEKLLRGLGAEKLLYAPPGSYLIKESPSITGHRQYHVDMLPDLTRVNTVPGWSLCAECGGTFGGHSVLCTHKES